ncbi:MAG: cation:dicarboxylase symporter family transporter [Candidatus Thermoplasmatota archaeon]|nr:cation:dicarboxylase symporter family transporter [Candidatus Thermoplasmatota archaeon]
MKAHLRVFIGKKLLYAFLFGVVVGGAMWVYGALTGNLIAEPVAPYPTPFGGILANMLKMVVVPVVFFSLLYGSASLPIKKLGRVGGKTIGWYMLTSIITACLGLLLALIIRPGAGAALEWQKLIDAFGAQATGLAGRKGGFKRNHRADKNNVKWDNRCDVQDNRASASVRSNRHLCSHCR